MFAYQIAVASRDFQKKLDIDGPLAGAGLLFLRGGTGGNNYRLTSQPPLDGIGKKNFLRRVKTVAESMSANQFSGSALSFGGSKVSSRHRWHFVGTVCGDG
jgi:hypothetical protein